MNWQPGETAPKNGKPIWAWLYDSGIRLVRWMGEGDLAGWIEVADSDGGEWDVKFWMPHDAIPAPPGVGMSPQYLKWRDGAPPLRID